MDKIKAVKVVLNKLGRDFLVKARVTKYFKREGVPGRYKYYYTEAEYNKAKGENPEIKKEIKKKIEGMTLSKKESLKKNGVKIYIYRVDEEKELKLFNKNFNNFDIQEFEQDLKNTIQNIDGLTNISDSSFMFEIERDELVVKISIAEMNLHRKFYIENNKKIVEHSLFELDKKLQANGICKTIFKKLLEYYEKIGVSKIKTHADIDIGGYTWAKAGYSVKKSEIERVIDDFNELIGSEVIIDKKGTKYKITIKDIDESNKIYDEFYKKHDKSEMFPMHLIANIGNAGKALLLESNWRGEIDLENKEQKEIFKNYINKV